MGLSTLVDFVGTGSPLFRGVVLVLLAGSVATLFITLERYYYFRRARVDFHDFMHGLFNILKNNKVIEAVSICDRTPGPVAAVLRSIVLRAGEGDPALRQAATEAGTIEVGRMELRLRFLSAMVYLAPLLGLLGVVVAMEQAFSGMNATSSRLPFDVLVPHLQMACLAAIAGLGVSIIAYAAYHYFLAVLESVRLDMEKASMETINFLLANKVVREALPAEERKES
jgi:biopolymer transport protein ExbB